MASADVSARPQELPHKSRKGLGQWMKGFSFGTFKGKNGDGTKPKKGLGGGKNKKKNEKAQNATTNGKGNNPYPESGHLQHLQGRNSPQSSVNGQLSFATSRPPRESFQSSPRRSVEEREAPHASNKTPSRAPTLATNAETIHSDTGDGRSKAATITTRGGALSSIDGAGGEGDSTFSSPAQSQRSLTTTLTTIQSSSAGGVLNSASNGNATAHHHGSLNNPNQNVTFSHQYPVSPAASTGPGPLASAIPRHLQEGPSATPNSYAAAGILLSDNASILTLASSSKRRRRSMDTDASVRALAPSSVWGGSRESLPLSVLSSRRERDEDTSDARSMDARSTHMHPTSYSASRPSIGGLASAERASVYSSSGITAPALASERNSYYKGTNKDYSDAKSLRSLTNVDARSMGGRERERDDARSTYGGRDDNKSLAGDARSVHGGDAKSLGGDVASLRNYEASVRSGAAGHGRQDSLPGSTTGVSSPLATGMGMPRVTSTSGAPGGGGGLSRRSSGWAGDEEMQEEQDEEREEKKPPVADVVAEVQREEAEVKRG